MLCNDRLQQILLILGYMLILAGAIWGISLVYPVVLTIVNIVSPFLLAFILAYVFNPLLTYFQEKFKLSREGAVVIGTVGLVGTAGVASFLFLLIVFQQGYELIGQIEIAPQQIDRTLSSINWFEDDAEDSKQLADDDGLTSTSTKVHDNQTSGNDKHSSDSLTPVSTSKVEGDSSPSRRPTRGEYAGFRPGHKSLPPTESSSLFDKVQTSFWNWVSPPSNPITGALPAEVDFETAAAGGVSLARQIGIIAVGFLNWLLSGLVFLSFTGVVTFFMLLDFNIMTSNFWKIVPVQHRNKTAELLARIDYALGGYLRGQISVCFVVGLIWTLWLMLVLGLYQYALLIGFITGLMNFVPYLGAFTGLISGILYVLLGEYTRIGGPMGGIMLVIVGFAILQAIEGFVLQPLLVGKKAELHPLIIIFALLLGSQFGIAGMLLAVPVAVIVRVLLKELFWKDYMRDQKEKLGHVNDDPEDECFASEAMLVFKKMQLQLDEKARSEDWPADENKPTIKAVRKARSALKEKIYHKRQDEVSRLGETVRKQSTTETSADPNVDASSDMLEKSITTKETPSPRKKLSKSASVARKTTKEKSDREAPASKRTRKKSSKGSYARSRRRKKSNS